MVWEWVCAAGITSIGLLGYSAYLRRLDRAAAIENAPSHEPGPALRRSLLATSEKRIPYVSVQGEVRPVGDYLLCGDDLNSKQCVIRETRRREHKSVYVKSTQQWQSSVGTISSSSSEVPFTLCSRGVGGKSKKDSVEVKTPLEASGLILDDTNVSFHPVSNPSIVSNISDFVSGEKVRGYEEVEQSLRVGVLLTGIGELSLINDRMIIQRPVSGLPYILSAKSKDELALDQRNAAGAWKTFCYVCFFIGGSIALFALYRRVKKWWDEQRRRNQEREFAERQTALRREYGSGGIVGSEGSTTTCVVCLEKTADVVLLNCGHLCSCSSCVSLLNCCPVCRGNIERYVPVFAS